MFEPVDSAEDENRMPADKWGEKETIYCEAIRFENGR